MTDSITLTELIGEGQYIDSPMDPDHFDTIVDALDEGPVSMNLKVGTSRVDVTVEYLGPKEIHEQAAQEDSICVDVQGSNCGFELYPDPDVDPDVD